jgi:hypothetical protein
LKRIRYEPESDEHLGRNVVTFRSLAENHFRGGGDGTRVASKQLGEGLLMAVYDRHHQLRVRPIAATYCTAPSVLDRISVQLDAAHLHPDFAAVTDPPFRSMPRIST